MPRVSPSDGVSAGRAHRRVRRGRFPFTQDDHIDLRVLREDPAGVVCRIHAAVDGDEFGQRRLQHCEGAHAAGMGLSGADVSDHRDLCVELARDGAISKSGRWSRAASKSVTVQRSRRAPPTINKPSGIWWPTP